MKPSDRKKQLIAQGAVYRAEVILGKQAVRASLQPDSLAKSLLHRVALTALSAFRNRGGIGLTGANLQMLLPLVGSVAALVRKKPLLKRTLAAGAIAAGIAAIVARKRKSVPGAT